jgi:hypothetical protein
MEISHLENRKKPSTIYYKREADGNLVRIQVIGVTGQEDKAAVADSNACRQLADSAVGRIWISIGWAACSRPIVSYGHSKRSIIMATLPDKTEDSDVSDDRATVRLWSFTAELGPDVIRQHDVAISGSPIHGEDSRRVRRRKASMCCCKLACYDRI